MARITTRPVLEIQGIYHSFGKKQVLENISLELEQGDIVCILGPSGSGKSTLLRIIAGLLRPVAGTVRICGVDQARVPTYRRDLGFVFQDASALFPHLNVYDNVVFPFHIGKRTLNGGKWQTAVRDILHLTGLQPHARRSLATLSGGEMQRVALARALVYKPSLLLLDEPLSSLDNILKDQFLEVLLKLHKDISTSMVYVTHDDREAFQVATKIAVLDERSIRQWGTPLELAGKPASMRVARILGNWNLLEIESVSLAKRTKIVLKSGIELDLKVIPVVGNASRWLSFPAHSANVSVRRPAAAVGEIVLNARVVTERPRMPGWSYNCVLCHNGEEVGPYVRCHVTNGRSFGTGSEVWITLKEEDLYVYD